MKLNEFVDKNGNKVNMTQGPAVSNTSSKTSSGSFKKRFEKLLDYAQAHKNASVNKTEIKSISDNEFSYSEKIRGGYSYYDREITVYIGSQTEAWRLRIYIDNKIDEDLAGQGWPELLRILRYYITVPVTSTPEYKDILVEWVDENGKKVSPVSPPATSSPTSYKKRFEKLIKYHIDHASSELESITKKDIKDYSFHLGEHYNDGHDEFDRELVVAYDSSSDTFFMHIFVDTKEVQSEQVESYSKLVKVLEPYMYLPDSGTQEYDDLLVEWVDSTGKKVNTNSSTSSASSTPTSSKTNKEKFTSLLYYMKKHKASTTSKAEAVRIDDGGFTYKEYRKTPSGQDCILTLLVGYSRFNSQWSYELYWDTDLLEEESGSGFVELLGHLYAYFNTPKIGSKEYKDLCESCSSIVNDFKEYENLWD